MDLAFLKTLYHRPGPYVSVYADLTRTTEDASKAAELRWRALRADLEVQGAPKDTLRAVGQTIDEELTLRRSEGIVIFAADGAVVYSERLPEAPAARTPPSRRFLTSCPTWPNAASGSRTCWRSWTAAAAPSTASPPRGSTSTSTSRATRSTPFAR
ncbi:hypothetical protein LUW76_12420 [Actinomadura madurae]|uniref:hypothetical protein n=1 Tax=Actinomadura madurae TaxID=1993 RepID=UPI002025D3CB|nr:hypothetical protein [Actinomadura madurae]URM95057.1 hypothetical protein LUW76_12420 [Actinomadura madurae]